MDLGNLLAARIMETVQQGGYQVVEREKLEIALRELNLGSSSLSDTSTRLRIGRIAGANRMIFGAYQVISDQMRLDLRMVDVETGRIIKTAERTAASSDLSGWLKAAESAAKELI
jgi:curli biogenesis system outer membrane secretion channel CsgG